MVGAIKGCTGVEPTIVGKPSPLMIDYIVEKYSVERCVWLRGPSFRAMVVVFGLVRVGGWSEARALAGLARCYYSSTLFVFAKSKRNVRLGLGLLVSY